LRPFAKRSEDASAATLQISSEEVGGEDVHVFGVRVSATNLGEAVAVVQQAIRERKRIYICVTDANAALVARRNEKLKDVYGDAAMAEICGLRCGFGMFVLVTSAV
jgi:UDP-N-acetyl-D-mannosaminuronic acid transferase (WecB/TagA/CpsF family)